MRPREPACQIQSGRPARPAFKYRSTGNNERKLEKSSHNSPESEQRMHRNIVKRQQSRFLGDEHANRVSNGSAEIPERYAQSPSKKNARRPVEYRGTVDPKPLGPPQHG